MSTHKTYPSRVNYWVFGPLTIALLGVSAVPAYLQQWTAFIGIVSIVAVVYLPRLFYTRYTINGKTLKIVSGFFINVTLDIRTIEKVTYTKSALGIASLALTNRIEIFYNKSESIIITPKRSEDFINTLTQINPSIVGPLS